MAQRNYLTSTTDLSLTASGTTIGSGNTQSSTFVVARTLVRSGLGAGELLSGSQTWSLHYVVSAMATPYEMRLKVQRLNSGGTMQAESGYTTVRSATGTYDDPLTADLGTWAAGDQLAVVWEHRRPSGTGNKSGTIDANGASYLDAPAATSDVSVNLTGVSSTLAPGSLAVSHAQPLAGAQITGAAGTLTPRIENIKVRDEFIDTDATNATAHTAEVGGPWTAHPNSAASAFIASNRLTKDSNSGQALLMANATVTGDGYVEIPLRMLTAISVNAGLAISVNPTSDDYIYARHNNADSQFSLRSTVPGSTTVLGTVTQSMSPGDERLMRIERRTVAGDDQFRLLVGGAVLIDWVTSNGHTGTRVGIRFGGAASSTTGYAIERFEAGEFVTPSPDVTVALTGVSATAIAGNVTPTGGTEVVSVRLVQLNVQHGTGTDGVTDYARQVAYLTSGKDIVCMQERSSGTTTPWDSGMAAAGFDEVAYRENGHGSDGPSIWVRASRVTVNAAYDHALSTGAIGWNGQNVDKAAVGVHVTVAGRSFYIFCTHLAWSAGADSEGSEFSAIRDAQSAELHSWIDSIRGGDPNVILAGDMNFTPTMQKVGGGLQIDIYNASYSDLWEQGIAEGKATANWSDLDSNTVADMPVHYTDSGTHDTRRRIDYVFLHYGASLILVAIDMPDPRTPCSVALTGSPLFCPDVASDQRWGTPDDYGKRISDHNPIEVEFLLSPDVTVSLTGAAVTTQAGSLAVDRAQTLTGNQGTVSAGQVGSERTVGVSGVSGTLAAGNLAPGLSKALSGNVAALAVGSLVVDRSLALTGVATTGEPGTLAANLTISLSGNVSTVSAGSLAVPVDNNITIALSGVSAAVAAGNVGTAREVALSGNQATSEIGDLDSERSLLLPGLEMDAEAGILGPGTEAGISGSQIASAIGSLTVGVSQSLTGVSLDAEAGVLSVTHDHGLTGVSVNVQAGAVSIPASGARVPGTHRGVTIRGGKTSVSFNSGKTTARIRNDR